MASPTVADLIDFVAAVVALAGEVAAAPKQVQAIQPKSINV